MAESDPRPSADVRPWSIRQPNIDRSSVENFSLRYVRETDSVLLFLGDPNRPTIGYVLEGNLTLLIDPETDELLGIEVDHFIAEFVPAHPDLEPWVDRLPGVPFQPARWARNLFHRDKQGELVRPLLELIQPKIVNGRMPVAAAIQ